MSPLGRTSLYGQHLQMAAPRAEDAREFSRSAFSRLGLTTAHFEQTDINKYVDLRFAYAFQPSPFIHEARAAVHSAFDKNEGTFGYRLTAGIVQLPALPFYGVEGGRAFSFEISGAYESRTTTFRMGVQRNAPDLLVVFPYAYDATNFFLRISARDTPPKKSTPPKEPRP